MTAPNIVSPTTITLKNVGSTVGTAAITIVTCDSNKAVKVSSLYAANIQGTNAVDVTCRLNVSGTTHAIASTVSVPADATLVVVDRDGPVYLEEGDTLEAFASAADSLHIVACYEEIA